jgi:hypothetical protein
MLRFTAITPRHEKKNSHRDDRVRLKIDEALAADRGRPQGSGRRIAYKDVGWSRPIVRRHKAMDREAAIFLAGSPVAGGGGEPPWHVHGFWRDRKART